MMFAVVFGLVKRAGGGATAGSDREGWFGPGGLSVGVPSGGDGIVGGRIDG